MHGLTHRPALVNGEPGFVFYDANARAVWVAALEIADGIVVAIRSFSTRTRSHIAARGQAQPDAVESQKTTPYGSETAGWLISWAPRG